MDSASGSYKCACMTGYKTDDDCKSRGKNSFFISKYIQNCLTIYVRCHLTVTSSYIAPKKGSCNIEE